MTANDFDLDAYLNRIGLTWPVAPDLSTLHAICAAQPARIAFENFDPFLGRVPALDSAALQAKLLAQRRGGYCYEVNGLLHLALQAIGFEVTGLAARVLWGRPPDAPLFSRSHRLLLVTVPGDDASPFIADAGFGGRLIDVPLPLRSGLPLVRAAGSVRLVALGEEFVLQALGDDEGWQPVYRFGLEAQLPVDYEPMNWFTARRPGGLFGNNLVVDRLAPTSRSRLFNDRLVVHPHGGVSAARRIDDAADLAQVLDAVFDLAPPVPADELFARLPRGLDGPYLPPA